MSGVETCSVSAISIHKTHGHPSEGSHGTKAMGRRKIEAKALDVIKTFLGLMNFGSRSSVVKSFKNVNLAVNCTCKLLLLECALIFSACV